MSRHSLKSCCATSLIINIPASVSRYPTMTSAAYIIILRIPSLHSLTIEVVIVALSTLKIYKLLNKSSTNY